MRRLFKVLGTAALAVMILGVTFFASFSPFAKTISIPGSVLSGFIPAGQQPTFEGPDVQVFGLQPSGSSAVFAPCQGSAPYSNVNCIAATGSIWTTTGSPCSSGPIAYSWNWNPESAQITSAASVPTDGCKGDSAILSANVNAPFVPNCGIFGSNCYGNQATIGWKVPDPYNPSKQVTVTGYIVRYQLNIHLSMAIGSSPDWGFTGDTLWFQASSTTWNHYYSLSSNPSLANGTLIGAWSAPLLLVQDTGADNTQGQCQGCTPENTMSPDWRLSNNNLRLFTTPQAVANLPNPTPSNANTTLASNNPLAPDTGMSQYAYFGYTLGAQTGRTNWPNGPRFGAYNLQCGTFGCTQVAFTTIDLTLDLYTLQIGQYLWTNPLHSASGYIPPQPLSCSGFGVLTCAWDGLLNAFGNPLFWLGSLLMVIVILAVVYGAVKVAEKIP